MAIVDIILSEDQKEGTKAIVSQWLFNEGDFVEANEPLVELETDKVMMEIVAPASGVLTKIHLNSGDEATDSQALGQIDSSTKKSGTVNLGSHINDISTSNSNIEKVSRFDTKVIQAPNTSNQSTLLSPAVRRLIQQHNLDILQLKGSGRNGRVTSRDIHEHLKSPASQNQEPVEMQSSESSEQQSISNMRRSIANHMVESLLHTAPHVTSVFNLDLSKIIAHRKTHKEQYAAKGVKLTFTAYFIQACVYAIKKQPLVNSQWHEKFIEVFHHMNIGVGTALGDGGLIVPVIRNCEQRDLFSIAKDLTEITTKARNNQLKPQDVKGGTFTISNHGVSGSLLATPIIINQPQSAILGLGKMEKRVVVEDINGADAMVIKPMCYVTLTIDHRVLDAHQTNMFLAAFVEYLQAY